MLGSEERTVAEISSCWTIWECSSPGLRSWLERKLLPGYSSAQGIRKKGLLAPTSWPFWMEHKETLEWSQSHRIWTEAESNSTQWSGVTWRLRLGAAILLYSVLRP